jgi:NAD(P)-dependent dehydrogenase (short-subunit alcohol dehydrogenase family)
MDSLRQRNGRKYKVEYARGESTEEPRRKVADYCAQRSLTKMPVLPQDCANALVLASDQSANTTGQVVPVDGGLWEAFQRWVVANAESVV